MELNFYQSLGLLPDDSFEKIRLNKRNIRRFSTDSNGILDLNKYSVLRNAYKVLSDPNTREQYDNNLKKMKWLNDSSWLALTFSPVSFFCFSYELLNNPSSSISWIGFGTSILSIVGSSFLIKYSSNHVNGSFSLADFDNQRLMNTKVYSK